MTTLIFLPLTFVVILSVCLWFIILGKGYWWFKCLLIATTLYFSIAIWFALYDVRGWATDTEMPNKFILHWSLVAEPSHKHAGGIFLWATEINNDFTIKENKEITFSLLKPFSPYKNLDEPRVYRKEYTRELHKQMIEASKEIRGGRVVVGERNKKLNFSDNNKPKSKKSKNHNGPGAGVENGSGGSSHNEGEFNFYELPQLEPPNKDYDE
jgi:hypothetical protein